VAPEIELIEADFGLSDSRFVTDDIVSEFRVGLRGLAWKADAVVPPIYHKAFAAVDPTGSGDTTVNALSRVLQTSLLPAATVDKVRPQSYCTLNLGSESLGCRSSVS
jgi:hypothetical protein